MTREEILMNNAKLAAGYLAALVAGTPPVLEPVPDSGSEIERLLAMIQDPGISSLERYILTAELRELRADGQKPPKPLPLDDQIKNLLTKAGDSKTSPVDRYNLLTEVKKLRATPGRWDAVKFERAG
jgi:hypothetical protein